jgi:hypothetical protein
VSSSPAEPGEPALRPAGGSPAEPDEPAAGPELVIGLVASPGAATDLANDIAGDLAGRISARVPGRWTIQVVSDRLVERPADLTTLVMAARRRMLAEGWQLVVCVTDLPLQTARRPVVAHASATHGVAVLSLPALGPIGIGRRATDGVVRLVAALVGDAQGAPDGSARAGRSKARMRRRVRELGATTVHDDEHGMRLLASYVTGNLKLLLGMLRANRPWRLAIRLSRALVAALAAGIVALVTSDIWRLSDALGPLRLTLVALGSVAAVVATLVIGADLWERVPRHSAARRQVALFNVVTIATVLVGVAALYLALLVLSLLGALLLVPSDLLAHQLGHPAGITDQIELAWLASSVATVGGALGAGLETDEAVREAAYGYVPDAELTGD